MAPSPKDSTRKGVSKSPPQSIADIPTINGTDARPEDPLKVEPSVAEPLAPPPRPGPQPASTPDYFSGAHGHLSNEANPFEFSFAGGGLSNGGGLQTPGGTKLPSVAALTSPAPHLGPGSTPNFWASLRSGPLSPAMLSGPAKEDYFSDGHHLRGGFPTPNESGLRSGLTPGGGGSMFPEPSPGGQHIFSQLATGGGATPGTLDFHRTAMSAAAQQKRDQAQAQAQAQQQITSQPQELMHSIDVKPPVPSRFDQHDANDAANGLYLLAQAHTGPPPMNGYAIAPQMAVHAHVPSAVQLGGQSSETSPHMANRNGGSISTTSGRAASEVSGGFSDDEAVSRPNTRGKGKRTSTQEPATNGRRKVSETPAKGANKRAKTSHAANDIGAEPQSEEELDMSKDEYNANGKKLTDEEKRKNFLERNRVAALKCRQRKKQWLANLQNKVEVFTVENDSLSAQNQALRDEIVNLKTLLLAHKDCPVTQQQGIGALNNMAHMMVEGGYNPGMNPYNMAINQQQQQQQQQQHFMAQGGIPRRAS